MSEGFSSSVLPTFFLIASKTLKGTLRPGVRMSPSSVAMVVSGMNSRSCCVLLVTL